jgi:hypothetical protein
MDSFESDWDRRVLLTLETRMMERGNHRCAAEAAEVPGRAAWSAVRMVLEIREEAEAAWGRTW